MKISVVVPVYYGAILVDELVDRLDASIAGIVEVYEIILVEDGSPDQSWEAIKKACANNKHVKGIKLSKNFGQHYAITAGLQIATGDWVVVMDCDLQDQPEEIPKLYAKAQEGYDIVFAKRVVRQDRFLKKLSSLLFYKVFGYLTGTEQDATVSNFGIYSEQAIEAVLSMKDHIRYFPTMIQWVGFQTSKVEVEHSSRGEGKSSYSWGRLLMLASDNIIAFSDKPLRLTVKLGFAMAAISFVVGIIYLVQYFLGAITVMGFTSIIITISFLSGLIIMILGIIGLYLGKAYEQTKGRPNFIIHKKINL
ncbi:MAG: glycosyltransferase family 2 protein [Marinicellaceae bacterium]